MRVLAYAVWDDAVKAFIPPFWSRSEGEAKRSFMAACRDQKGFKLAHAADYTLFHIGYFDDASGLLEATSAPGRVMTGLEAVADPMLGATTT